MPGCSGPRGLYREGRYAEGQQVVSSWVPVCPVRISGVRCRYVAGVAGQDRSAPAHCCGPCGPRIRSPPVSATPRTCPRRWRSRSPRRGVRGRRTARPSGRSGRTSRERRRDGSSVVDVGPRSHCASYIQRGPVADRSGSRAGSRAEPGRAGARSAAYRTQLGDSSPVRRTGAARLSAAHARRCRPATRGGCGGVGHHPDELVRRTRAAGFEALLKARVQARVQPPQRPRITQETSVTRGSHSGNGREIASCEAALQRPDRRPQHRSTRKGWLP